MPPSPHRPPRPTPEALAAAENATVPDLIAPGLSVLFCGINPSLYSAAVGLHFARPGNRFWPALHASGFTPRTFAPWEGEDLLRLGYGITNVVPRATATADRLSAAELVAGRHALAARVARHRPRIVALLGLTAYRTAFERPRAAVGRQPDELAGATLWILPNPSGLNAHYQLNDLAALLTPLRLAAVETPDK